MVRIFSTLSLVALALMVANFLVGLTGGDFNAAAAKVVTADRKVRELMAARARRDPSVEDADVDEATKNLMAIRDEYRPLRSGMTLHILLGVAAGLVVVLVNSLSITYFVGTSKWFREVVDAYGLDPNYTTKADAIKRANFPWATSGLLSIVLLVALGAAADASGANAMRSAAWVQPHYLAAMAVIVWVAFAFWQQSQKLGENQALIREVMLLVQAARQKRGLPTEALELARAADRPAG